VTELLIASNILLWIGLIVVLYALFGLYHHFGQMYLSTREGRSSHGPKIGARLKATTVTDMAGSQLELPVPGTAALLLFTSTSCEVCEKFLPQLDAFIRDHDGELVVVVICAGEPEGVRGWLRDRGRLARVVADPKQRLGERYGVGIVPYCLGVNEAGEVRTRGVINTRDGLESMADRVMAPAEPPPAGLPVRSPIPWLESESQTQGGAE